MVKKKLVGLTETEIGQIRGAMYVTASKQPDYAKKSKALYEKLGKIEWQAWKNRQHK